jgi:hypothetical protein
MAENSVTPGSPKFNLHKVFASIGIILTVSIIILAAVWWFLEKDNKGVEEDNTVKVTTSSAKPATESATKSASPSAN